MCTEKDNHRELRRDMLKASLEIEPERFLELFLPSYTPPSPHTPQKSHNKSLNPFADMNKPTTEKQMYHDYIKALNKIIQGSDFTFFATPIGVDNAADPDLAVDCGMYPLEDVPKDVEKGKDSEEKKKFRRACWSGIDLPAECKLEDEPFEDVFGTRWRPSRKRKDVSGQALSYIELTFNHQHRTFVFMLIFTGLNCRLLRVDRSGMFFTKRFNITKTDFLVEFLLRYVKLSPAARGFDTTAERIDPSGSVLAGMMKKRLAEVQRVLKDGEADRVEEHVVELWRNALDEKWPWWKLHVPEEGTNKDHWFLVGKPSFQSSGVLGRGTRCYIAVELFERDGGWELDTKFVHLKDCWRVVDNGADGPALDTRQEGITLQKLNDAHVRYVPTLVAHGDIMGQSTQASVAWKQVNDKRKCCLKTHRHYRLTVKEIGKPLSEFKNSGQLVLVLYDCLRAHRDAMRINIIHRDISGGNILLYKNEKGIWRGLLTDWELSKDTSIYSSPQQVARVGTAQFAAARALDNPSRMVTATDEIECFVHVLVFYAVRFLHHNIPDNLVGLFVENYFYVSTGVTLANGELNAPLFKRQAMTHGSIMLESYGVVDRLRFMWVENDGGPQSEGQGVDPVDRALTSAPPDYNHPLNVLLDTLLSWFHGVYKVDFMDRRSAIFDASSGDGACPPRHDPGKPAISPDSDSEPEKERRPSFRFTHNSDPNRPSPEQERRLRDLAAKLNDHKHVVRLFRRAIHQGFPSDKTEDRRPEKGYAPSSLQTPHPSDISGFSNFGLDSDSESHEVGGVGQSDELGASNPKIVESVARHADSDGERVCGHGSLLAAPVPANDDVKRLDGPCSPSPCSSRPKRAREDDVASSDLSTSGKRNRS